MSDVKSTGAKRASPTRRERAKATAAAIVAAATVEFETNGYHATTMATIAKRAGVAVQTVHFVFHTKGELLAAAVSSAVLPEGDRTPPEKSAWFLALLARDDPSAALRQFVQQGGQILVRASALNEVARSAAATDPDAAAAFESLELLRWEGYRVLIETVATKAALGEGLDVDSATDVLFALFSPRTYLSLTRDRAWSPERALGWIAHTAPYAILRRPEGNDRADERR